MSHEAIPTKDFNALFDLCRPYVMRSYSEDIFAEVEDETTRRLGQQMQAVSGKALSSFVQWHGVGEELSRAHRMLNRYPWYGTEITKSQHLETTWFLTQNLCYHFKEKAKLFYNQQKEASKFFDLEEPSWLKAKLKFIDKEMGEAIRDRGNTVHGWNSKVQATYTLSAVEILQAGDSEKKDWDIRGHYADAKWQLRYDAKRYRDCAFQVLKECFFSHQPTPNRIVQKHNEICDAVFSGNSRLVAKEN